ncbi:MAG: ORF6N domain-containing protein [Flavobacteriaceae bacterium]|jgi:hypothetical protein|nr:ORF6N domain-containing protein [Flavobacteriaceae bacterium]
MQLQTIQTKIHEIRGQKIILDFDLAEMYGVETKYLKRAVRINLKRFPPDFMFELTKTEWESLRCNFSTLETGRGKHPKYLPFAFTEQGVAMLSSVLNSDKAIEVNILIMRAFVFIRQYALSHQDLTEKLKKLEQKYNKQFKDIYEVLNFLTQEKQKQIDFDNRKRIGFNK